MCDKVYPPIQGIWISGKLTTVSGDMLVEIKETPGSQHVQFCSIQKYRKCLLKTMTGISSAGFQILRNSMFISSLRSITNLS